MTQGRSRFGEALRRQRRQLGLSQEGLARHIARLVQDDATLGDLGTISEKAISNLESIPKPGERHVKPRPNTVRLLAIALQLAPESADFTEFFAAADSVESGAVRPEPGPLLPLAGSAPPQPPDHDGSPVRMIEDGREAQLRQLQAGVSAAASGRAQLVFVAGESGVGKTVLVREVCRRAERAIPDLVVAWGECSATRGLGEPFQPFRQIFALLTGDADEAAAHRVLSVGNRARLRGLSEFAAKAIVERGPDLIGPFVSGPGLIERAERAGAGSEARFEQLRALVAEAGAASQPKPDHLFEQVQQVMRRMAGRAPLLLVLDDLHWADDATCALLFHLARRLHKGGPARLLIVGTYRPPDLGWSPYDQRHPLEPVVNEVRRYQGDAVIDLATTLGEPNGRAFVDALIDAESVRVPDDVRHLLFERTEGQPLFATELLRSLRERGALVKADAGTWIASNDVTTVDLPDKVGAVITERLGRLRPELRDTLACASAQGQYFTTEIVAQVLGLDRFTLARRLDDELTRRHHLLAPAGTITVGPKTVHQYRFAHALFQEFLYGSLLPLEREALHAATAAAMESLHGSQVDEVACELARHFDIAGEHDKASFYYRLAADAANTRLDTERAVAWYHRAIELAKASGNHVRTAQCLVGMANSLRLQERVTEAIVVCSTGLELCDEIGDLATKAAGLTMLGLLHYDIEDLNTSLKYLLESLELASATGDRRGQCTIENLISHAYYALGQLSLAMNHAERARLIGRGIGDAAQESEALIASGNFHCDVGAYDVAIGCYEKALAIQRRIGERRGEAVSLLNIGLCYADSARGAAAIGPLEEGLSLGQRISRLRTQGMAHTYLGLALEGLGRAEVARQHYADGACLLREVGQPARAMDGVAGVVRCDLQAGDLERAKPLTEEILAWVAAHDPNGLEYPIRVLMTCIRALDALGDAVRAQDVLRDAHALFMERADRITDEHLRWSYTHLVPFNWEVLQLWEERGPDS